MARKPPPEQGRFRKGQSGNPKGRPRKTLTDVTGSAFDIVIDRVLGIMDKGVHREMSVDEALEQRTYQAALAGDRTAQREVFRMIARREKALAHQNPPKPRAVTFTSEACDPRNVDDALRILGIAATDPSRHYWPKPELLMLIEPWAVKAALRRRAARHLGKRDLDEARRCTRDAATIDWPEPEGR